MSGHTPGPWHSWDNGEGLIGVGISHGNHSDLLHVSRASRRPESEDEANMRLCAAAPDLLEALESLTADRLFYYDGDTDAQMNVTVAAYETARAAIARAKGEK